MELGFSIFGVIWIMVIFGWVMFKPRIEGILFRRDIIKRNPDNIHLGNMGYLLALNRDEEAAEELRKHLIFKVNDILKEIKNGDDGQLDSPAVRKDGAQN